MKIFQNPGFAVIAFCLILSMSGCKGKDSPDKGVTPSAPHASSASARSDDAHRTIIRYNQLLSEGYKSTNMTNLQEVATKELAEKAYYHMAAIGEGKRRLVSEVKKIDFVGTDCSDPVKCKVVTKELWDFAYADILTGTRSNEVKNYIYDVRYTIEKRDGRWLITEIAATGEERKELPSWQEMYQKK